MNQNDRDFLHGMMLERMTLHYGAAFPRDKERAQRSSEMENKLSHALMLLLNNPPRGNRQSGKMETAIPAKWKPVFR